VILAEIVLSPVRVVSPHGSGALEVVFILNGLHYPALRLVEYYVDGPGLVCFDGLLLVRLG
jgi:hypothetical protein